MGRTLPAHLARVPFSVARARASGLRQSDLRAMPLARPTQSVRVACPPEDTAQRAAAFAEALPPDAAFSHVTAALLLRLPLPPPLDAQALLDVMRPDRRAPTRRRGCIGHRGLELREVIRVQGLRVVGPVDTWVDLGEVLHRGLSVDDLVVLGDAVVNRDPAGRDLLRSALARRTRARGAASLATALDLVRVGVRSPMETRARLVFARAGFPEPEVNAAVRDRRGGWLLEGDLVWRRQRVIGEYQGGHHATRRRRSADAHRAAVAASEGWTVIELFAEDVRPGPRRRLTLSRFARALGIDLSDLDLD